MGRKPIDLTGQRFGRLTVLGRDESKPRGAGKSVYWICQCDCTNVKSIRTDKLRNGDTKSCGCLSKETRTKLFLKDLTGQRFGHLTVLERDLSKPTGKNKPAYWICQCDCGETTSVRRDHLEDGTTIGCGCNRGKSKGELKLKQCFEKNNIDFKQEYTFSDLKGDSDLLRFDFAIFKENNIYCLVEYQGEQHYTPLYYDTEEKFNKRLEYDNLKKNIVLNIKYR